MSIGDSRPVWSRIHSQNGERCFILIGLSYHKMPWLMPRLGEGFCFLLDQVYYRVVRIENRLLQSPKNHN